MPSVDEEIEILVEAIKANGYEEGGQQHCKFGALFTATEDTLEALIGTLKAAKKRNLVDFKKPMLFKGQDDNEIISLK
jgi:hypothetical protein